MFHASTRSDSLQVEATLVQLLLFMADLQDPKVAKEDEGDSWEAGREIVSWCETLTLKMNGAYREHGLAFGRAHGEDGAARRTNGRWPFCPRTRPGGTHLLVNGS